MPPGQPEDLIGRMRMRQPAGLAFFFTFCCFPILPWFSTHFGPETRIQATTKVEG